MATLSCKKFIEVPVGSLDNNRGDIDRINAVLHSIYSVNDILWPLDIINSTSALLRSSNGRITITLSKAFDTLRIINSESGNTVDSQYGFACDIGTTVVAAELIDLSNGDVIVSNAKANGQIEYGEDLLTRLHFAARGGVTTLRDALLGTINSLIADLCKETGIDPGRVSGAAFAGNTSMSHLLLGLDASVLRQTPFTPIINHIPQFEARDLGMHIASHAPVYILPSVGSYLGGDLIAGCIASGLGEKEGLSLLLDIGTNGEMILGNKDWLIAGSGAAGPALEGGVAECAGRAEPGAIDQLTIDPVTYSPNYHVIGEMQAHHMCGSGLVDVIAELLKTGLIDSAGHFSLEKETGRWRKINNRQAFVLQEPDIYITDRDIESFLRTKAAMTAALTVLLDSVDHELDDIETIYTAGSFGTFVSIESAKTIGLYPNLPTDRFMHLGNGSLQGAHEVLLDTDKIEAAEQIADSITYLELAVHPRFMGLFRSSGYFGVI